MNQIIIEGTVTKKDSYFYLYNDDVTIRLYTRVNAEKMADYENKKVRVVGKLLDSAILTEYIETTK